MTKHSTLFYSWQSDDLKTRNYIEKALKKALKNVATSMNVEDAPRFDKDTQGEVGAVSITATIKRKINQSKIFLADVSLVDTGKTGKKLANQNVMFELGYALGKKSENAVMLVANSDLGEANELPFDIAQSRIVFCSPSKDPKAAKLIPSFEGAIRAHLGLIQEAESSDVQENAKEQLMNAVENGMPTQTKAETFFEGIFKRYLELAPEPVKYKELYTAYGERTFDSYQKTLALTEDLFQVITLAAEYADIKSIKIAYKLLGSVAARYDQYSNDEYASLVIQEIASIIFGCLSKFEHWEAIQDLIGTSLTKPKDGIRKYKIENTYQFPEGIKQYYNQKTGMNYSIATTPLLQERFVDNDKILQAYVDGSLILMLALEFYYPYVSGILLSRDDNYYPDYVAQLSSKAFAERFLIALGLNNLAELRKRLEEKSKQPLADITDGYWNRDITNMLEVEKIMPVSEKVGAK